MTLIGNLLSTTTVSTPPQDLLILNRLKGWLSCRHLILWQSQIPRTLKTMPPPLRTLRQRMIAQNCARREGVTLLM